MTDLIFDKENENILTPEQVGLSSSDITSVLDGFSANDLSMHSLLVMKDGRIIAEGYAKPYDKDSLHRMYSVSKSFVSIAIGVLEAEGKISLEDTIDKYYPEYLTENTDPRVAKARIVDLLRMASPYKVVASCRGGQKDWIVEFFNGKPTKTAGESYDYDTGATHILGTIVERETGMSFFEYLKQKALLKVGFSENTWCVKAPEGYAWGGSGILCTSRELALFADLVMNMGEYKGEQLLPRDYCRAATSYQISTKEVEGDSDYYGRGYGYQIWINPHGFAFMGMGNQHAYCIPQKGLVIVCTADNQGNKRASGIIYELFEKHIINKIADRPLPEDNGAYAEMKSRLESMTIPHQRGALESAILDSINGRTFEAACEEAKISSFKLDFYGDEGALTYKTPRGEKKLLFGMGRNVACLLDEPTYSGETIGQPNNVGYKCLCSGAWTGETTFALKVQVVDDYLGNMTLTFDLGDEPRLTGQKTAEWFLDEYKIKSESYIKR